MLQQVVRRKHCRLLALLAGLVLLVAFSSGATTALPAQPKPESEFAGTAPNESTEATIRYFNREIATLRGTFLGRSPEVRAKAAQESIERIVSQAGTASVGFKEVPQGLLVMLSNQIVFIVIPDDLDTLHQQTLADARIDIARHLGEAVLAAEYEQTPRQLLIGALWSMLATAIAIALFVGLHWAGRQIREGFKRWMTQRTTVLHKEPVLQLMIGLQGLGSWVLRVFLWVLVLLLIEEWVRFVLNQFAFTRPWGEAMTGWVAGLLGDWVRAVVAAIPGLIAAIAILFVARFLTQAISLVFGSVQGGRFRLFGVDAQLAEPTRKIVIAIVWLFAIAMAYPYLPGAESDAFKGLSVLVGLMISLGASSIVGQAAGGFTLLYARTMTTGDLVRIGDVEGMVMQIGLFTTRIRTVTGVEVSIPNNVVLGGQLLNYSRNPDGPGMWLETGVTIGYDAPWRQIHRMLLEAAEKTAKVQTTPAPYVLQTALSDFYVEYRLRARVEDVAGRARVLSELHGNIQDVFNAAGVQIMSPNYEADPEHPKVVRQEHWEGLPVQTGGARSAHE